MGVCTTAAVGGVDPLGVARVHLIQANHLDLGFSDLLARVMNRYVDPIKIRSGTRLPRTVLRALELCHSE